MMGGDWFHIYAEVTNRSRGGQYAVLGVTNFTQASQSDFCFVQFNCPQLDIRFGYFEIAQLFRNHGVVSRQSFNSNDSDV
jgi:hypothetical protein